MSEPTSTELDLEPVTQRFTLRRGIHDVPLGRAVIATDGWRPRADAFRVVVEDGELVVEVAAEPLDQDDSRDVALAFGVFAPGDDREHMADDPVHGPGGSWSNQTLLGEFTVDDVEYTVVAEFTED